jgi:hypothetical protein
MSGRNGGHASGRPDADAVIDRLRRTADDTAGAPHTAVPMPGGPRGGGEPIPGTAAATQAHLEKTHTDNKALLTRALQTSERTNAIGEETTGALAGQRETIQRSLRHTDEMSEELRTSRVVLRDMKRHLMKEKVWKALIIGVLLLVIWLIIYFKWVRKKS